MRVRRTGTTGGMVHPTGWLVLLLPLLIVACASPAPRPPPPPVPAPLPEPPVVQILPVPAPPELEVITTPAPAPPPSVPAAMRLAEHSESAVVAGDLRLAALHLERALRIAPRDADLWHRLARVRLAQLEFEQAERMAERSLQLGAGDRRLALENWRIIAQAREALGDTAGARRAWDEVLRLESALG
jgi:cytochrome c-type biogenesis protein CcmH/NrfG